MLEDLEFPNLTSAFSPSSQVSSQDTGLNDDAMEELFREIIRAPSSPAERMSSIPLPLPSDDQTAQAGLSINDPTGWVYGDEHQTSGFEVAAETSAMEPINKASVWMGEEEMTMQKILDLLPLNAEDDFTTTTTSSFTVDPELNFDHLVAGLGFDTIQAF